MIFQETIDVFKQNENIGTLVELYKKSPRSQKYKLASQLINHINKINKSCMCNMIKQFNSYTTIVPEEVLFVFLYKCKTCCNFCQIKYVNRLQREYVKKLLFHNYLKIFNFEDVLQDTMIVTELLKSNNMSYEQMLQIVKYDNKIIFSEDTVVKITSDFIKSDYNKHTQIYELLSIILSNEELVEKQSKIFSEFVINLVKADKLELFDNKNIQLFANNDIVINHAIKICSVEQINKIVDKCDVISITHANFYNIYYNYESSFVKKIISKMTNVFSYISYCANKMNHHTVNLVVESGNIIKSLPKLNDQTIYEDLCGQTNIFINYIGEVGYDASGLRKDFFSNCSLEFLNILEECDGYLTIPKNLKFSEIEIKFISLMLARSIFVENISLQIRLHPILTYFMINGGHSIQFDKFSKYISHFEIEFITNTFKLLNLSNDDYATFIELQGNDRILSMTREQYIINKISRKYVNPKLIEFVNGFRVFFKSLYFVDFVNPNVFHKYVCGNESYEIVGNTTHSLKTNLNIIGLAGKQHDLFKNVFLDILEHLNNTSIVKLQMFLKYWFATSSIISFSDRNPNIYVRSCLSYTDCNKYHCFYSATCFDKLTITIAHKDFGSENTLRSFIINAIDSSIENQRIWETSGVHMQLA